MNKTGFVSGLDGKGNGIAHDASGRQFLAGDALPGDVVVFDSRAKHSRRAGKKARKVRALHSAWDKFAPFCQHYGVCGGCGLQHLSYENQLVLKQRRVRDLLHPLCDVAAEEHAILPSSERYYYRNRVDYTFGAHRWRTACEMKEPHNNFDDSACERGIEQSGLGFHVKGFYDKVVNVSHCFLHDSNALRQSVRRWTQAHNVPYYDSRAQRGVLRTITVRRTLQQHVMVIVSYAENSPVIYELCDYIVKNHPEVTSLYTVRNTGGNDSTDGCEHVLAHGTPFIEELCGSLRLQIYPQVFYQTNSVQARMLYETVRMFADIGPRSRLLDLYCGIGSIGLFCARGCKSITGVDIVPQSVEAARENARYNSIDNARFFSLASERAASDFLKYRSDNPIIKNAHDELRDALHESNVIVVDPPRAGLHKNVISYLLSVRPETLVYAACNPITLARDLADLLPQYRIAQWQSVDMFPHTHHVETVVQLKSR